MSINVLLVAYDFPPVGGIGVQRIIKFAKYLPDNGINPIVLTNGHGLGYVVDHSLMKKSKLNDLTILRKGAEHLTKYYGIRDRKQRSTIYPYLMGLKNIYWMDVYSEWYRSIKSRLKSLIEENQIQCVFTTSPPHSTHLIGRYIKQHFGTPWVMDLRDSMVWAPCVKMTLDAHMQRFVEKFYERSFVRHADAVVGVSQPMIAHICERVGQWASEKTLVIPNGYDMDDFEISHEMHRNSRLTFTYCGTLQGKQTPEPFCTALESLFHKGLIEPTDVLVRFVGRIDDDKKALMERLNSLCSVDLPGFVDHKRSIAYQQGADVLLLLVTGEYKGASDEVLTGKVFEYMAANKPVLAIAPEGALKELIIDARLGEVVSPRAQLLVERAILGYYRQWKQQAYVSHNPRSSVISSYARNHQSQQLSQIIRRVIS